MFTLYVQAPFARFQVDALEAAQRQPRSAVEVRRRQIKFGHLVAIASTGVADLGYDPQTFFRRADLGLVAKIGARYK